MTFEFNFVLVGLMQIVGFFVQGCTGFGCTVIAAAVTNGLLGTTEGVPYGTLITLPFLYFLGIKAFKEVEGSCQDHSIVYAGYSRRKLSVPCDQSCSS